LDRSLTTPARPAGKEVASLEALLRTRAQLHDKRLEEGRRRLARLEREAETRAAQNAEVGARRGWGGAGGAPD
jgi:hypothetical protein